MTAKKRAGEAERAARNRGLREEERRQHDPDKRAPHRAVEQDAPEPERLTTPAEEREQDIARLENPPQAEGPRERNNEGV